MTTVLEERVKQDNRSSNKYCHVVCDCSPQLGLCGAYKTVQCGISVLVTLYAYTCPACKNEFCQDCTDLIDEICFRCGR